MELGERIKAARLEAGLSQRALCGEVITRNMLSLIESGRARPSMDTLRYLAGRLGKPIGYFFEEQAAPSPDQAGMEKIRQDLARRCVDVLEQIPGRSESWYLLRGQAAFVLGDYAQAAVYLSRAEPAFSDECVPALEACYRELEDYRLAYEYACKQK